MDFITWLNDHLSTAAQILGSFGVIFTAVFLVFPQMRPVLLNAVRVAFAPISAPWGIRKLARDLGEAKRDLAEVSHQVSHSGGWIQGDIAALQLGAQRFEGWRQHNFRIQARPSLEMDSDGNVLLVSDMTCDLFKVNSDVSLRGLSYLGFLDPGSVDEFSAAFEKMARNQSEFRFQINMHSMRRTPLGLIEWVAKPIGPVISGKVAYAVNLYPIDETALAIATRMAWSV